MPRDENMSASAAQAQCMVEEPVSSRRRYARRAGAPPFKRLHDSPTCWQLLVSNEVEDFCRAQASASSGVQAF